jgi:MerR family transcriptional regulator, redox-sensitive transcriptional activator SoxR
MDPDPRAHPQAAVTPPDLTIGELAARSGVAPSALRYYERMGLIRATRTGGNQRRYDRSMLRRVAFIRVSAQVGIPLEEIGAALASLPDGRTPTRADWVRLSRAWRSRLDARIALLERLRDTLTGCIGCGCLSLQRCQLYNPGDRLAAAGPGPVKLLRG